MNPTTAWIQTYTGKKFCFMETTPEMICIEDIAHALSLTNRFIGHTPEPYSVAAHSLLVASLLPEEHKLRGLLHDASEAYIGDVSKPLKRFLPDYKFIENTLQAMIYLRFGVTTYPGVVGVADMEALLFEKTLLMKDEPEDWGVFEGVKMPVVNADRLSIIRASHKTAEQMFLLEFQRLTHA